MSNKFIYIYCIYYLRIKHTHDFVLYVSIWVRSFCWKLSFIGIVHFSRQFTSLLMCKYFTVCKCVHIFVLPVSRAYLTIVLSTSHSLCITCQRHRTCPYLHRQHSIHRQCLQAFHTCRMLQRLVSLWPVEYKLQAFVAHNI